MSNQKSSLSIVAVSLTLAFANAAAQESANKELDACIRKEQLKTTLKGALAGGLLGALKAKTDDNAKKGDTTKNVLVGAAAGGAIGFAYAHFNAVGKCYKKNPNLVPESKIERGAEFAELKKKLRYDPAQGVLAKTLSVQMPAQAAAGSKVDLNTSFAVMTPDGAETDVVIERKLFVVADGQETEIPFPGHSKEDRKFPAGESVDRAALQLPPDMPAGTVFRYEFSVTTAGRQASAASGTTLVKG